MDPNNENMPASENFRETPVQEAQTNAPSVNFTPEPEVESPVHDATPATTNGEQKSTGPIIGSIIIIVIIIIGGLYFWGKRLSEQDPTLNGPTAEEIAAQEDQALADLQAQSSSDEISDIEADLNNTDLDNIDSELNNVDLNY